MESLCKSSDFGSPSGFHCNQVQALGSAYGSSCPVKLPRCTQCQTCRVELASHSLAAEVPYKQ
eukprot:scaffold310963_cov14-Prasinocladus_malaysianus.AAC.1